MLGSRGMKMAPKPNVPPAPNSKTPFTFPPTSILSFPVSGSACRSNFTIPVTFAALFRTTYSMHISLFPECRNLYIGHKEALFTLELAGKKIRFIVMQYLRTKVLKY